jgi:hypothetical protein
MKQLRGVISRIAMAMARAGLVTLGVLMQIGTFLLRVTGCGRNGNQKKNQPEKAKAEIQWQSAESPYKGHTVVHQDEWIDKARLQAEAILKGFYAALG